MHTLKISIVLLLSIFLSSFVHAQNSKLDGPFLTKRTIKVYGDCETCRSQIEKTAKKVPGVRYAHWDADSKTLLVEYLRTRTNPEKIQQAIAAGGHDTEKFRAETANAGPAGCCHYREGSK